MLKPPKTRRSTTTMVAPTGEDSMIEMNIPRAELIIATAAEQITT